MIRNLLATTAVATLIASGAFAQDATTPAPAEPAAPMTETAPAEAVPETPGPELGTDGHLATMIIGENVYDGTGEDANHIGDVSDIVIGADGGIDAVVVGVGGFLGIGAKDVAIDFAQLEWTERDGDRWLVAPMTKEQLEQQVAFDRTVYEPEKTAAASDPAASTTAPSVAPAPDSTAMAPADPAPADQTAESTAPAAPEATTDTTTTAAIDRSTLKEMPAGDIRAEEMVGTTVYGSDDANVGEIGDVVLTPDGKVDAYIVNVGGFLGVGEKEVAVGSDNLQFMTDADNNKYLYTTFTKEQLDAAPAYDEGTYAEKRTDQRLMVQ